MPSSVSYICLQDWGEGCPPVGTQTGPGRSRQAMTPAVGQAREGSKAFEETPIAPNHTGRPQRTTTNSDSATVIFPDKLCGVNTEDSFLPAWTSCTPKPAALTMKGCLWMREAGRRRGWGEGRWRLVCLPYYYCF